MNVFNKIKFWAIKNSPEILEVSSIIFNLAAVVSSAIATSRFDKKTIKYRKKIAQLKSDLNDSSKIENQEINPKETKSEIRKEAVKLGATVVTLYLPSALFYAAGTASTIGSHNILKGRYIAMSAAYSTLANGYAAYRSRVASKLGDATEKAIYDNVKKEKDKDSESVHSAPQIANDEKPFEVVFDENNRRYESDHKVSIEWLSTAQAFLNQKLKSQGFLFLSDAYSYLGYDVRMIGARKAQASHILGWLYDPKDPTRDNVVDFGMNDANGNYSKEVSDFIQNKRDSIVLSFNVDGDILNGKNGKRTFAMTANEYNV